MSVSQVPSPVLPTCIFSTWGPLIVFYYSMSLALGNRVVFIFLSPAGYYQTPFSSRDFSFHFLTPTHRWFLMVTSVFGHWVVCDGMISSARAVQWHTSQKSSVDCALILQAALKYQRNEPLVAALVNCLQWWEPEIGTYSVFCLHSFSYPRELFLACFLFKESGCPGGP